MKKFRIILAILIAPFFFTSCIVVDNTPGPNGRDGRAYFGVDYDHRPPYSYWDNNNSIPFNPVLGEYYHTYPGIYEFEYFINEEDYYYGTYEVWINRGGFGGPRGEPGFDGVDTYLMLVCDPNGFYEHTSGYKSAASNLETELDKPIVIEKKFGKENYKITMRKANVKTRKAKEPKFIER